MHPDPQTPACSVIIPTRNCLRYLKQAIRSAQQQTLSAIEIIVADDHSEDGTWAWLSEASRADPRIRPIQVSAGNPASARNQAAACSRADLLAFLDADDLWHAEKLRQQIAYHQQHPNLQMSYTDYRHVGEQGDDRGTCFEYWSEGAAFVSSATYQVDRHAAVRLFKQNLVGTSTVVVRKAEFARLGGFNERLPSAEDWDLWLRLALNGAVAVSGDCSTQYLMRANSETSRTQARIDALELICRRHATKIMHLDTAALRMANAHIATAYAEQLHQRGQRLAAWLRYLQALLLAPNRRRLKEALGSTRNLIRQA